MLYAFFNRGIAAPAVHLCPPRDSNFEGVPVVVPADLHEELIDKVGAFGPRTHYAHIAFQDIDELRQFVDAGAAQEYP